MYVKSAIISNMVITSIYSPARKNMLKKNVGFTCFAKKKYVTKYIQKRSSANLEKTVLFYTWLMQLLGLKRIRPLRTNFLFLGLHHTKTAIKGHRCKKFLNMDMSTARPNWPKIKYVKKNQCESFEEYCFISCFFFLKKNLVYPLVCVNFLNLCTKVRKKQLSPNQPLGQFSLLTVMSTCWFVAMCVCAIVKLHKGQTKFWSKHYITV